MSSKDQLEQQYLKLQERKLTVTDFEQWLYSTKGLEESIGVDLFQELIIQDYNSANIKSDLRKILSDYIDVDKHKREAFLAKLDRIIRKDADAGLLLMEMYEYYRQGYRFLEDLGLGVGILVKMPPIEYEADTFEDLGTLKQIRLINQLHPVTQHLARLIKKWINTEKLILFQEEEFTAGSLQFKDFRTKTEKQAVVWEAYFDAETGEMTHKRNRLLDQEGRLISRREMHKLLLRNT